MTKISFKLCMFVKHKVNTQQQQQYQRQQHNKNN